MNQSAKRTNAMAGLVARFLPVVEAFFVANARDPQGNDKPQEDEVGDEYSADLLARYRIVGSVGPELSPAPRYNTGFVFSNRTLSLTRNRSSRRKLREQRQRQRQVRGQPGSLASPLRHPLQLLLLGCLMAQKRRV